MTDKDVRVRFAPSPTGALQLGNARTALFNYLFARKFRGVFVLRIEDTDKERSRKEWEADMMENLSWLGMDWDEGPGKGDFGPYRQSERTSIYEKYLQRLLDENKAYWCFCTAEELEAQRQSLLAAGQPPRYLGTCKALSREDAEARRENGEPAVIRFIVQPGVVVFEDLVRGEVKMDAALLGDIVIAKDLQSPLYNFSVVVDDYEMKVTYVIRGEDHLPNTPKQILLQQALGFPPVSYAHLPLLLGEDRTKLSKRHGDMSVTSFRQEGYFPEALVNFLVLLGWNPGDEREIFSLEELVKEFSVDHIQKGGAVVNRSRLDWMNGWYVRHKSLEEVTEAALPFLESAGLVESSDGSWKSRQTGEEVSFEQFQNIVRLYQERLKKLSELPELVDHFFKEPSYDKDLLVWKDASPGELVTALERAQTLLETVPEKDWTETRLQELLMPEAEKEKNRGYMLWPFRVGLTGKKASAGPFETAAVLGKQKTLERIGQAKEKLL